MSLKDLAKRALSKIGLDVRFAARYDAATMQRRLLAGIPVRTVVDVGAYHGIVAEFYRKAFPLADVYAFEPYPESAEICRKRHQNDSHVHIVSSALGESSGTALLHVNRFTATNSLLPTKDSSIVVDTHWVETVGAIHVPVVSLDEFAEQRNLDRIQILKIDVQGAETAVLAGSADLLSRGAIDVVYAEVIFQPLYAGGGYPFEICRFLNQYNYVLFGIYNLYPMRTGRMLQADAIFTSPSLAKQYAS
ncbi:MAG: FkbM family methyltransferase [Planctomycetota bacterium]